MVVIAALLFCAMVRRRRRKPFRSPRLAAYTGADREQRLIAGAKVEGKVVWYTSLAGSSYKDLAKGFETKYGIKIEPYRATSTDIMTKVTAEAQAKQVIADVIETTLPTLRFLRESKLLHSLHLGASGQISRHAKENATKGLVLGISETYVGITDTTQRVSAAAIPKNRGVALRQNSEARSALSPTRPARVPSARYSTSKEKSSFEKPEPGYHSATSRAGPWPIWCCPAKSPRADHFPRSRAGDEAKGGPIDWAAMEVVPTNTGGVVIVAEAPHSTRRFCSPTISSDRNRQTCRRPGIRQRVQTDILQTLVSRGGNVDDAVRQGRRALGEITQEDRQKQP